MAELSSGDILSLPYDESLTLAGVGYVGSSIHQPLFRTKRGGIARLRRIAQEVATELAIRRWLQAQHIPVRLQASDPLLDPQRLHLALGSSRLTLVCSVVSEKRRLAHLLRWPSQLLREEAAFSTRTLLSDQLSPDDLCVFAFLLCRETKTPAQLQRALELGLPAWMVVIPPRNPFARLRPWSPLEPLAFKSRQRSRFEIELGGQLADHSLHRETIAIPPTRVVHSHTEWHSWLYMRALDSTVPALTVYQHNLPRPWEVQRSAWDNLWFYGLGIILVGWMAVGELRRATRRRPAQESIGFRPFGHDRFQYVQVAQLHPMAGLATWLGLPHPR